MSNTITWLHLSDLHAGKPKAAWDARRVTETLVNDLQDLERAHGLHPDLIFFTGDAAFGQVGRGPGETLAEQFALARGFFDQVRQAFAPEVPIENLFLVPGNHDVNRQAVTPDQTFWLDHQSDAHQVCDILEANGILWRRYMERLAEYRTFLETSGYAHLLDDPGHLTYAVVRQVAGVNVGIGGFNSAWSCGRDGEKGLLWMGSHWQLERIQARLRDADLTIALLHHPANWLVEWEAAAFWHALERGFRFILHEHEHTEWVTAGVAGWTRIAAGACYERSDKPNGYNVVRLDLETGQGEVWLREYDSKGGGWVSARVHKRTDARGVWSLQHLSWLRPAPPPIGPIRLLHLSDLHFTAKTPVKARLQWLLNDLKQGNGGLGFHELDYLVISGDLTDKGSAEGLEKACEFVSELMETFNLSADRCVFVPGNHDVKDLSEAFEKRIAADGQEVTVQSDKYSWRFQLFSKAFFEKLFQRSYPLDYAAQGMAISFWETGIQFLALNSCWQIDQFNRKRAGVHPEAVAHAIYEAQKQEREARKAGQLAANKSPFRIAVWHHSVTAPDFKMADVEFLGHLQRSGVRIALHGDVHEMRRELIRYWHERRLHIVGAGSFGVRAEDRPESTPRLYNVLEIARDFTSVRVHTRCQPKPDGVWDGWHEWPDPDGGKGRVPYYDIQWP